LKARNGTGGANESVESSGEPARKKKGGGGHAEDTSQKCTKNTPGTQHTRQKIPEMDEQALLQASGGDAVFMKTIFKSHGRIRQTELGIR
jgi:hypothetical protein